MDLTGKLKIGLVGLGVHAKQIWLPLLANHPKFVLMGISSENNPKSKTESLLTKNKLEEVEIFNDHTKLISNSEFDCFLICTSNDLHLKLASLAIKNGKHVLCEKPLGYKSEEISQISNLIKDDESLLTTGFMYRHHPQWDFAKKFIDQIKHEEWRVSGTFQYNLSDMGNARLSSEKGGGALLDVGIYFLDLIEFLDLPKPNKTNALIKTNLTSAVDTLSHLTMEFDSNRFADFHCSMNSSKFQEIKIFGDKQSLILESPFIIPKGKKTNATLSDSENKKKHLTYPSTDCYKIQLDLFAENILSHTKSKHLTSGIKSALWLSEILDSIK